MRGVWIRSLIAVLIGNAIYYLVLYRHLPPAAQHRPYQLDWGVAVDFWVCLVVWGLQEMALRRWKK